MLFNYELGLQIIEEKVNIVGREAVRAIILNKNSIFMIRTNKGDYKFPGGGVNINETHDEALEREIKEETGYIIESVTREIGVVIERNIDKYESNSVFEMISYYYLCKISDKQTFQQLDDYEKELEFRPVWIDIDKAIEGNDQLLKDKTKEKSNWVERETTVLKSLQEELRNLQKTKSHSHK